MKKTLQQVSGYALIGEELARSPVDIFIENGIMRESAIKSLGSYSVDYTNGIIEFIYRPDEGSVNMLRSALVDKKEAIDSRPWCQPLSFSLQRMVARDQQVASFWTIRPDTLEVLAMQQDLYNGFQDSK